MILHKSDIKHINNILRRNGWVFFKPNHVVPSEVAKETGLDSEHLIHVQFYNIDGLRYDATYNVRKRHVYIRILYGSF